MQTPSSQGLWFTPWAVTPPPKKKKTLKWRQQAAPQHLAPTCPQVKSRAEPAGLQDVKDYIRLDLLGLLICECGCTYFSGPLTFPPTWQPSHLMHFVTVVCVPFFKYFCMLVDELVFILILVQALGYVIVNKIICVPVRQHLLWFKQPGPCSKTKNLGVISGCVNLWRGMLLRQCSCCSIVIHLQAWGHEYLAWTTLSQQQSRAKLHCEPCTAKEVLFPWKLKMI